ncbi:hypothetical protein SKAU_G00093060 [Synaphobranchus kaupii]|uniref:Uncharacterized protein n=1 Tax=Synaphobranchus kaupii TaxID=118154 RepID=A0A9Q1FWX1_SYNKA|nr:hypothetical protein SKAU_G00093060 [Synaphobranchus kaupii]
MLPRCSASRPSSLCRGWFPRNGPGWGLDLRSAARQLPPLPGRMPHWATDGLLLAVRALLPVLLRRLQWPVFIGQPAALPRGSVGCCGRPSAVTPEVPPRLSVAASLHSPTRLITSRLPLECKPLLHLLPVTISRLP